MDSVITIFNSAAFLMHLTLAILCGVLGNVNTTFPLYMPFTTFSNTSVASDATVSIKYIGSFPMTALFVTYFSVTAFFHFGNVFLWNEVYFYYLERRKNPFRWTEYSITAPLMTSIIAYISGTRNYLLILASATLTFSTTSFGFVVEETRSFASFLGGLVPFAIEFTIIFISLYVSTECYPDFLPITIIVEFVLWILFPLVCLFELAGYPYKMGELAFILLSFLSKSVLAIILLSKNVLNDGVIGTC